MKYIILNIKCWDDEGLSKEELATYELINKKPPERKWAYRKIPVFLDKIILLNNIVDKNHFIVEVADGNYIAEGTWEEVFMNKDNYGSLESYIK